MFNDMKDVFRMTIKLATDRYECEEPDSFEVINLDKISEYKETEEYKRYRDKEMLLETYLEGLDFEQIKILQTIMYLGRDKDYDSEEDSEAIYNGQRKYMDSLGWTDKRIETNQMLEKTPLNKYLINGLKILGIKY